LCVGQILVSVSDEVQGDDVKSEVVIPDDSTSRVILGLNILSVRGANLVSSGGCG
jgi:hypothetical protein